MLTNVLKKIIPNPFRDILGKKRFDLKEWWAKGKNPPFKPDDSKIILDITYDCNLKCIKCNRSCRYAPSNEYMTIEQIKKFIQESINYKKKWKHIWIEGGEPTLHPDIIGILKTLFQYKKGYSPRTQIQLNTNGYDNKNFEIIRRQFKNLKVYNSRKTNIDVPGFCSFNLAPVDFDEYKSFDFSGGCYFPSFYGLALNMHGFYHCTNAGGIDRVIGLNIGKKELPHKPTYWWKPQMENLCKYCGHFQINNSKYFKINPPEVSYLISSSWDKHYKSYAEIIPGLNKY